jgi:hypothetical protein
MNDDTDARDTAWRASPSLRNKNSRDSDSWMTLGTQDEPRAPGEPCGRAPRFGDGALALAVVHAEERVHALHEVALGQLLDAQQHVLE